MKIEHIAMYVNNIEGMKDFYCNYFQAKSNELYHNPKTGLKTYFLTFDNGARLELMYKEGRQEDINKQVRIGFIHLAFGLKNKEEVDEMSKRLKKENIDILSGPRITGDGYYETCFLDPEGNQIEIMG